MKFGVSLNSSFLNSTAALFFLLLADYPGYGQARAISGEYQRQTGFSPEAVVLPDPIPLWRVSLPRAIVSSPVVIDGLLFIACREGWIYAINALAGGEPLWKIKTDGRVEASPFVVGESLIAESHDGKIFIIDKQSGTLLSTLTPDTQLSSPVSFKNGAVPAGTIPETPSREVFATPRPSQREKEITRMRTQDSHVTEMTATAERTVSGRDNFIPGGPDIKSSSIEVGASNLFVINKEYGYSPSPDHTASQHTLLALNKITGDKVWEKKELKKNTAPDNLSNPIAAEGKVFFGWDGGKVYAVNAANGDSLWSATLDGDLVASPAISDGKVFFATINGGLYAYDLSAIQMPAQIEKSIFAFPNPARGSADRIQFHVSGLSDDASVDIVIFSMSERPVKNLPAKDIARSAADDDLTWFLENVANGVYFARVTLKYTASMDIKWLKIAILRD
ncbi:PQQ-binding-like beta-propeller repeat protein [Fibrobacterota bacterium]